MHAVWLLRRTKPFGTIVLLAAHTPHNVHTKFHSADICDILSMNIWAINVVLNVKFRKPSSPSPYALLRMRVCRKPRYDVQILSCVDILPVRNNSEACGDVYRWYMPSSELDRNCVSRGRHTHTHTSWSSSMLVCTTKIVLTFCVVRGCSIAVVFANTAPLLLVNVSESYSLA